MMHRNIATVQGFLVCLLLMVWQLVPGWSQVAGKVCPYLFPAFTTGTLHYVGGPSRTAELNFHLVGQEVVMDFNGSKVSVNLFPDLDSVVIQGRVFLVYEGKAYEKLVGGDRQLWLEHRHTSQLSPNEGAYGTKSHTAAVAVAEQKLPDLDFYALAWGDRFQLTDRSIYWLIDAGGHTSFTNANQLAQAFGSRKKEVREKAADLKTNFADPQSVRVLVMGLWVLM